MLSRIKGIANLVNKSLLKSAGHNQMSPLFSLKGFGVRVTNQRAHHKVLTKFIQHKQNFPSYTYLSYSLYPHSSDLLVHLLAVFSSYHL